MAKTSILQVYCRHKRVTNVTYTSDNVTVKFGHYVGICLCNRGVYYGQHQTSAGGNHHE
jgi:hypothetical protein